MNVFFTRLIYITGAISSPTWWLADQTKKRSKNRGATIIFLNWFWLGVSIVLFLEALCLTGNNLQLLQWPASSPPWFEGLWRVVLGYFLWARCTEIFRAFLKDALDKTRDKYSGVDSSESGLLPSERLLLAFKSYIELVLNFSMLYSIFPSNFWTQGQTVKKLTDMLYYSASAITTGRDGTLTPCSIPTQFLSVYEVFCGITLLVVCFTIYAGMDMKSKKTKATEQSLIEKNVD